MKYIVGLLVLEWVYRMYKDIRLALWQDEHFKNNYEEPYYTHEGYYEGI